MKFILSLTLLALALAQEQQPSTKLSPNEVSSAALLVKAQATPQVAADSSTPSTEAQNPQTKSSTDNNSIKNQDDKSSSTPISEIKTEVLFIQHQNQNRKKFQTRRPFQNTNEYQNIEDNRFQLRSNDQSQGRFNTESFNRNQEQGQQSPFQSRSSQGGGAQSPDSFHQGNRNRFSSSQDNQFSKSQQFQENNFQPTNRNSQQQFQSSPSDVTSNAGTSVFEPLNLPSGARFALGAISLSFTCANRPYGYYADQSNACRVFHVCNPHLFSNGQIETYQYSFMCGKGTIFDQKELVCVKEYDATPCQEASTYYSRNAEFGLPQDKTNHLKL